MKIIKALLALLAALSLLAATDPANARTDDAPMSEQKAGEIYLNQICRDIAASYLLGDALPVRDNGWWYTKDLKGQVFVRVKKASRHYSNASFSVGSRLLNPPAAWPDEVADRVKRQANFELTQSEVLYDLGYADTANEFTRLWNNRFQPLWTPMSKNSRQVRALLGLPPNGKGC